MSHEEPSVWTKAHSLLVEREEDRKDGRREGRGLDGSLERGEEAAARVVRRCSLWRLRHRTKGSHGEL